MATERAPGALAAPGSLVGGSGGSFSMPVSPGTGTTSAIAAEKRESAESIEPPERRAQLLVTLIAAVILVMVFSLIVYRMVIDKAAEAGKLKTGNSARTPAPAQIYTTPTGDMATQANEVTASRGSTAGMSQPDQTGAPGSSSEMSPSQSTPNSTSSTAVNPGGRARINRRRPSSARDLVCVVTEMTTQEDQYPAAYCTHLIYSDVVFDPKHRKFLATKNDKSFELFRHNQRTSNMSHLVALNPHQTLNVYLNGLADMEIKWYFVQMLESLMNEYHFDGIAFIGIELTLDNVQQFSRVLDKLKEALTKKPTRQFFQTIFGGYVNEIEKEPTDVATRIRVISEEVDIFILETHYQRPLPLCKTVFPSAVNSYGSFTPSVPINTGLGWMRAMQSPRFAKSKGNICISLSMVALLFKISGNVDHLTAGNPCSEEIWMNYAETCVGHGWSNVKTHAGALTSFRHKIKFWQSFDTDITVTRKVDLMLDQSNKTCLAAYYVDYEDYSGMCQGKVAFPRLKAIREQLNKRTNVDEDIDLFGFQF